MSTAVGDHLQKAAAAVLVLQMLLEMRGKLVDLFGKEGNLHLRRAGILVVDTGFLDSFCLFLTDQNYQPLALELLLLQLSDLCQWRYILAYGITLKQYLKFFL